MACSFRDLCTSATLNVLPHCSCPYQARRAPTYLYRCYRRPHITSTTSITYATHNTNYMTYVCNTTLTTLDQRSCVRLLYLKRASQTNLMLLDNTIYIPIVAAYRAALRAVPFACFLSAPTSAGHGMITRRLAIDQHASSRHQLLFRHWRIAGRMWPSPSSCYELVSACCLVSYLLSGCDRKRFEVLLKNDLEIGGG